VTFFIFLPRISSFFILLHINTKTNEACTYKEFNVLRFESLSTHEEVNGSQQIPFQGYPRSVTSMSFSFKSCLKATLIYPSVVFRKHLIRDSGDLRFMFNVYGFDLLERIWIVSIVMTLVVVCLFGCICSTILVFPPYISFKIYVSFV
jgi:hypothetical protein